MDHTSEQNRVRFDHRWREPLAAKRERRRGMAIMRDGALVLALVVAGCAAALAEDRGPVAILPFKLLDTSGEPIDQQKDHNRRLEAMGEALKRELRGPATFSSTALVSTETIATTCPTETSDCLLSVAQANGAKYALFGVLHKSSTLIMQLFLTIVALDSRDVVVSRDFNFRGDNDESWIRAKDFMVGQIQRDLAAKSRTPAAAEAPR